MMQTTSARLPEVIEALRRATRPGGRFLSVLLDTSPGRQQGQAFLLSARDRWRALREELPDAEITAFDRATRRAEAYLTDEFKPTQPGVALYAAGESDYFAALPLPRRPADQAVWDEQPWLVPLEAMLDDLERVALVLFDKEEARIFTVFLDEIEERLVVSDSVPGRQATGGWFALAQTRYARHREDHVRQHAQRAIGALRELQSRRPFERLVLSGPDEALAQLRQVLPRPLRERLIGDVTLEHWASDAAVLAAARRLVDGLEQQHELRQVRDLIEAGGASRAALGLDATLSAANDGRLHQLVLSEGMALRGGHCRRCDVLTRADRWCPTCGQAVEPVADLTGPLADRALAQGASIAHVSGEAAAELGLWEGVGGWTRY